MQNVTKGPSVINDIYLETKTSRFRLQSSTPSAEKRTQLSYKWYMVSIFSFLNRYLYLRMAPKKRHFVLIKARMIAVGPQVVVFWTLSRLVLIRESCDAAFLLYSQSNIVDEVVMCSCVHQSLGRCASRRQLSHQGSTRVQLE